MFQQIGKAAIYRFSTYSIGVILQLLVLYHIIKFLDIYQFAIWGIANSFIFIFSIIGQLGFGQNIEKYFPNYKINKRKILFLQYFRSILYLLPIWTALLFFINYLGYFEKYNAYNLYILFLIIALSAVSESQLNIFKSYLLIDNSTREFDIVDLFYGKILKFFVFYLLLINNYSVYYLLFFNLVLRVFSILHLIKIKSLFSFAYFKIFLTIKITKNTFTNYKYNFLAFLDKAFYISFINLLFLISAVFAENKEVSHFTIAILIINNLRPVMGSLSSLVGPIISKNLIQNISNFNLNKNVILINSLFVATVLNISLFLVNKEFLYSNLLYQYEIGVYKIIFIGVISACLNSLYYPNYIENLYSGNEKLILKFTILNQLFCLISYIILEYLFLKNFIAIFLLYEFNNFLFNSKINLQNKKFSKAVFHNLLYFKNSLFLILIVSVLYLFNLYNPALQILSTTVLCFDFLKVKSMLKN